MIQLNKLSLSVKHSLHHSILICIYLRIQDSNKSSISDELYQWCRNWLLFVGTCVDPRCQICSFFYVEFCRPCLSFCTFFFWPFHCQSIQIPIIPLVSSDISWLSQKCTSLAQHVPMIIHTQFGFICPIASLNNISGKQMTLELMLNYIIYGQESLKIPKGQS